MICQPGITTNSDCPKCGAAGIEIGFKDPMVQLRCPKCGYEWRTMSSVCTRCKRPSGTTKTVICKFCSRVKGKV